MSDWNRLSKLSRPEVVVVDILVLQPQLREVQTKVGTLRYTDLVNPKTLLSSVLRRGSHTDSLNFTSPQVDETSVGTPTRPSTLEE